MTTTITRDDWLQLGALTAPWGIRGELKIRLDTDAGVLAHVKLVYLGPERRAVEISGFYKRGRFHSVKIQGIDSVEAADVLRGVVVAIPRAEAPPLPEGHYYVNQILGLRAVTTAGRDLGEVADVLVTGANDVYVVRGAMGELLIPAIRDVVVELDPTSGRLLIEPLPGMLPDAMLDA